MNDTPPNPIQSLPVPLWRHAFAMLYDTLLVVPLFMAAAAVWVAILGPTQSIDEPAVPAPLQWLTWVVILTSFFGIFCGARAKRWACKPGEFNSSRIQPRH